jgi:DNA topoisomerase VI subunit B
MMGQFTDYAVEVQQDFVARQTKAPPIPALAELIWNALDADATEVNVEFEHDPLGRMVTIVVSDNGHGISHAEAPQLFRSLGGSWKKHGAKTRERGRALHGQEGQGRFKALALGRVVEWTTVTPEGNDLSTFSIRIVEDNVKHVAISEPEPIVGARRGVTVTVRDVRRNFTSLKPENASQELSEALAIYLNNYKDVRVEIAGQPVNPDLAMQIVPK